MSENGADMVRKEVEVEGRRVLVWKRRDGDLVQYSFDAGRSWKDTMIDAYNVAAFEGLLRTADEPEPPDGFEAFVYALLMELKTMKPGEVLRVKRDLDTFAVMRETIVLATRASTLENMDIHQEEHDGDVS